jgi:6-phosphogluconolactonase
VTLKVLPDAEALAREVARFVAAVGIGAVYSRGRFDLVLAGGRTPLGAYRELVAGFGHQMRLWSHTHFWWGDERCVGPGHPDSNYRSARIALLMPLGVPEENVHRLPAESPDRDAAAAAYAAAVPAMPDLLLLGVGVDGHVASLFPASPALEEAPGKFVHVGGCPKPPAERVTVTPPGIASAARVLVLASGRAKAAAVRRALAAGGSVAETPARLVREALWMVDREADPAPAT